MRRFVLFLRLSLLALVLLSLFGRFPVGTLLADDPVFSGPQVGEPLTPFAVRGVLGDDAGKDLDFVTQANGQPIVLVFVHDVNRQSVSMTRILTTYTASRAKDGLTTGIIFLDDDATAAENMVKRIQHALAPSAPVGVSTVGSEGPGAYGLNRNVMLTILVGKDNQTTANFALVQPSLQADLPKVLEAVVQVAGGKAPRLDELPGVGPMMQRQSGAGPDANLRALIRPVIQKEISPEQVDRAAQAVETYLETHAEARQEVGRIATTIIDNGKLANYGTPRAQEYLQKWARVYGVARQVEPTEEGDSP